MKRNFNANGLDKLSAYIRRLSNNEELRNTIYATTMGVLGTILLFAIICFISLR